MKDNTKYHKNYECWISCKLNSNFQWRRGKAKFQLFDNDTRQVDAIIIQIIKMWTNEHDFEKTDKEGTLENQVK